MSKPLPDGAAIKAAKDVLHEIARKRPRNVSDVEKVFVIFQNSRYGIEKHLELMRQLMDGVTNGKKCIDEYRKNYISQGCFIAFVTVLAALAREKKPPEDSKAVAEIRSRIKTLQQAPKETDLESPPLLSSTRVTTMMHYEDSPTVRSNVDAKVSYSAKLWNFHEFEMDRVNISNNNPVAVPSGSQEVLVITELLLCLMGVDGDLFQPNETADNTLTQFTISSAITETHRDLAREILPLASYYSLIQSFVQYGSLPERGQVIQSLSAGVRHILQEYQLSLANLESLLLKKQLNLQKMLYFLRPIMRAMESLAALLQNIRRNSLRGGAVLTLLYGKVASHSGNEESQRIFRDLCKHSTLPYMRMLKLWIFKGVIWDPQDEFLIRSTARSMEWEMWYEVVPENVPEFLGKNLSKILRAGKYINVIRDCKGQQMQESELAVSVGNTDEEEYEVVIEAAYNFASAALLHLIMGEYDLLGRFCSVKRYFLLQQGDFIAQFMDESETELSKNVDKVIPIKMEKMLELRLRLSSANHDKYKDDLKLMFLPYGIHMQMNKLYAGTDSFLHDTDDISELSGIECFTFDYAAQWPVSIVLNRTVISKYQMIFRLLYYCKHVDRILCRMWADCRKHKNTKFHASYLLNQKMMTAIQNIENYMMIEVIEPNWHIFFEKLKKVKSIDDVLNYHHEFLELCLKNCMLTDPTLLKAVIKLCNLCLEFSTYVASNETKNFQKRVEFFSNQFTTTLMQFLKHIRDISGLNPADKFASLIHRINYNSFYTESLDKAEG